MVAKQGSSKQSRQTYKKTVARGESAHARKQQRLIKREERRKNRKVRRRIFPIWSRILMISLLSFAALVGGSMVGYGIIGDGVPADALKIETWQHIIDIVTKTQ